MGRKIRAETLDYNGDAAAEKQEFSPLDMASQRRKLSPNRLYIKSTASCPTR